MKLLRAVVLVSGVYDLLLGAALLFAPEAFAALFGVAPSEPPIQANVTGLFAAAVGAGYLAVLRSLNRNRWYLWIMGPMLKGGGAGLFLLDFLLRGSPASFLLFAASDGALAALTWIALWRTGSGPRPPE